MKTNLNNKTIELTKSEMKAAMKYGTEQYEMLQNIRHDYPSFRIVEVKTKKRTADFAKLDMQTIKAYVEAHGNAEQKACFEELTTSRIDSLGTEIKVNSFFTVKKWFLASFPQIKEERVSHRERIHEILHAAEATAEAAATEEAA